MNLVIDDSASPGRSVVPPVVAAAWRLTPVARRGPRAELTVDRIVQTALRLGGEGGLGAVSMAKVADELGFTTMSLYRHVGSKEELLTHVQDAALGPAPVCTGAGWRDGLASWTRQLLRAYGAHPWALDIPIDVPPLMPRTIEWLDQALQIMSGLALSPAEKLSTVLLLSGYARNEATLAARIATSSADPNPALTEDAVYERILRELVRSDRLPGLHGLLESGSIFAHSGPAPDDPDAFFVEFGIERILDGIEAHVDRLRS